MLLWRRMGNGTRRITSMAPRPGRLHIPPPPLRNQHYPANRLLWLIPHPIRNLLTMTWMGRSSLTIKKFLFLILTTKMRAKSSGNCHLRLAAHRLGSNPSIVLQLLSLNRSLKPTMSSILPWTPMMRLLLYHERLRSVKQPMQNCPRHLRQSRSGRKVGPILIAIFRREVQ